MNMDVYAYAGPITVAGYHALCDHLKGAKGTEALLVLGTSGGEPNAGFRIARALQHRYDGFSLLVPRYCKSAGTLVATGAKMIYMADESELGPLDVQLKKSDELIGFNSGLDIMQAVSHLQQAAMNAFRSYLNELHREARISTKVAADISTKLTTGLFGSLFGQVDPMRLGETHRAIEIAFAYANRLNAKSQNLRANGLADLVTGYPSHGFVIDRKEARNLFLKVEAPQGFLLQLNDGLRVQMEPAIEGAAPSVALYPFQAQEGVPNEGPPNTNTGEGGDAVGEPAIHGGGEADKPDAPDQPTGAPNLFSILQAGQ